MCVPRTRCDYGAGASLLLWKGFHLGPLVCQEGPGPPASSQLLGPRSTPRAADGTQWATPGTCAHGNGACVVYACMWGGGPGWWGWEVGGNARPQQFSSGQKKEVQLFSSCWFPSGLQAEGGWGAPTPSLSPSPHTLSGAGFPGGPWGRPRISASS